MIDLLTIPNRNFMQMLLEDITVYTLTGKKHIYKLGDMSYGQWLIFKNKLPVYYFDIFDEMYGGIPEAVKLNPSKFLEERFKPKKDGLTLTQGIIGLWSGKILDKWFEVEKLPVSFLE
jgi:hypothetical protein